MRRKIGFPALLYALYVASPSHSQEPPARVGPDPDRGGVVVATRQLLRPAGRSVEFEGRPIDLALGPDGGMLFAKDNRGLVAIDVDAGNVAQELPFPGKGEGGSMHGIAVSRDGRRVWATTAQNQLREAEVGEDGRLEWARVIPLPGPEADGAAHPCGIALSGDERNAYVALSRNNSVGVVDLRAGALTREIPVGVAPLRRRPRERRPDALRLELGRPTTGGRRAHRPIIRDAGAGRRSRRRLQRDRG